MKELLEIDLTVSVVVHFCDCRVELLWSVHVSEFFTGEEVKQLILVDLTTAICVEHVECRPEIRLTSESLRVHRGSQKL